MIFRETELAGVIVIEPEQVRDERGFFARVFEEGEFQTRGIATRIAQCGISHNRVKGTLRGLHYQSPPHSEAKLVRCTRGRVFDVVVDLRHSSTTFGSWLAVTLSAENRYTLAIPEGCAHGFVTLEDDCELFYQISHPYNSGAAAGIRWNDPELAIAWPEEPRVISHRDRELPLFEGGARIQ